MPGTESEVMSIVIDLKKKIVPPKLHILRKIITLYLWDTSMPKNMINRTIPIISVAKNAHGIKGTLSNIISGTKISKL